MSIAVISGTGCSSSRVFIRTWPCTMMGSSRFTTCSQSAHPFCAGRAAQQMTSTVPERSSSVRKPKRVPFSLLVFSRSEATTPTTVTLSSCRFEATWAQVHDA